LFFIKINNEIIKLGLYNKLLKGREGGEGGSSKKVKKKFEKKVEKNVVIIYWA
jgi:hypothetical protein